MANGFSSFAKDHHYASGGILIVVGIVGLVASLTGNLANAIAALWVPDILFTSSGSANSNGTVPSPPGSPSPGTPLTPINPAAI